MKSVKRPAPDQMLVEIADYVTDFPVESSLALDTARYCLMVHWYAPFKLWTIRHVERY
jgi:hypothetical protein